jgi:hypothetical protein
MADQSALPTEQPDPRYGNAPSPPIVDQILLPPIVAAGRAIDLAVKLLPFALVGGVVWFFWKRSQRTA